MPAYVVSELTIVKDEAVAQYKPLAKQSGVQRGGEYLARDAVPEALEGSFDPEERLVILRFPDVNTARAWYGSEAHAEALAAADGGLRRRPFIVEGP